MANDRRKCYRGGMSEERKICRVTIPDPRIGTLVARGGVVEVEVHARTLFEAAGLALAEFRRHGIEARALMSISVAARTHVVSPARFWTWLHREDQPRPMQEREIRGMLRDLLGVPLSREEKRARQQR